MNIEYPNLAGVKSLGFDTETYDPELLKYGPGWGRDKGHIMGISIATEDRGWYYPLWHKEGTEQNVPAEPTLRFLRDVFSNTSSRKIGANLQYDIGWLKEIDVPVKGPLWDVQVAEALIDVDGQKSLDFLGKKYVGEGKNTDKLNEYLRKVSKSREKDLRGFMYMAPPNMVAEYAEYDAQLPILVAQKQYPIIKREKQEHVLQLEHDLIPLLVEMRRRGVRVDLKKAHEVQEALQEEEDNLLKTLRRKAGYDINPDSPASISKLFDAKGKKYPNTENGGPSFTKEFLQTCDFEEARLILQIREISKMSTTFVEGAIINSAVNGRVHGQYNSVRTGRGGTKTGRFSSSSPNLQNIPSRDEKFGPLIRGMFLPEEGCAWRRYDYSQIEFRLLAHYAVGAGASLTRSAYNKDPNVDYHEFVVNFVREVTSFLIPRKAAKTINFGLIYGMGIPKLRRNLNLTAGDSKNLFGAYHNALPFVHETMKHYKKVADTLGYVETVAGRRLRFDLFEPVKKSRDIITPDLPYQAALAKYGSNIRRAGTFRALNYVLQGSAAEIIKNAMVKCYKDGIYDAIGLPLNQVHDELGFSDDGLHNDAFDEMKHIMETSTPLSIPIVAECEKGTDWGHCEKI